MKIPADDPELKGPDQKKFRSVCMRTNYLAADQPHLQFCSKGIFTTDELPKTLWMGHGQEDGKISERSPTMRSEVCCPGGAEDLAH